MNHAVSTTTPRMTPATPSRTIAWSRAGLAAAAGLPPVVDLALVPEVSGREDRRLGPDQVLPLGEQLVVGVHHAAGERPRGQVGQRREVGRRRCSPRSRSRSVRSCLSPASGAVRAARRRGRPGAAAATSRRRRRAGCVRRTAVTGLRWCSWAGSTTNVSSGANTHRSASRADRDRRPCGRARPARAGRCGHPAGDVGQAWPRARACVQTAGSPSCSEAMPPQACPKSPVSSRLRSGVHGEWSDTMQSMVPSARPCHSRSRLSGLPDRRAALELGRAVGDLLGVEGQVVRAGLDGEPHPVARGRGDHRQRVGAGQVQDVHPGAGPAGRLDDLGDGDVLGAARPGGEELARTRGPCAAGGMLDRAGVLGVHDHQRVEVAATRGQVRRRSSAGVSGGNSSHAGVEQEALEAEHARRRAALRRRPMLPGIAPPQKPTST